MYHLGTIVFRKVQSSSHSHYYIRTGVLLNFKRFRAVTPATTSAQESTTVIRTYKIYKITLQQLGMAHSSLLCPTSEKEKVNISRTGGKYAGQDVF